MATIRIDTLRSLQELAPLRAQMNALNRESRRPCPFSTFEYIETFLAYDEYGAKEEELLFLAAFEDKRLIGYVPLRKTRERLCGVPYGRIGLLVTHDTDRPHVVARRDDEVRCCEAFYEHLLARERSWSLLELAMQDVDSGLNTLPRLDPLRLYVRRFENMPNTTIPFEVGSIADYYRSLTHNQRKTIGRQCRRLVAIGKIETLACSDPAARAAMLDLYLDMEHRSWKTLANAGILRDPRRVDFFRSLCRPEQPLELMFDFVLHDDLPVAGLISGAFAGGLYGLEQAFDQEYEHLGPGHLLSLTAIHRGIAGGYHSLNLDGNYAYYKSRMGGVVTETSAIQIFRVGSVAWLRARCGELKRKLRPPPDEPGFNPERRRVTPSDAAETAAESPPRREPKVPARSEERERARSTLASLEANGVRLERLGRNELEQWLPFSLRKEAA
jgi:hypothetical protein